VSATHCIFFLFWIVSVVELWNVNAGRINAMF